MQDSGSLRYIVGWSGLARGQLLDVEGDPNPGTPFQTGAKFLTLMDTLGQELICMDTQ